ncbi:MAG: hypothetical protein ACREFP_12440 [Acetobacteraceae bacterium]
MKFNARMTLAGNPEFRLCTEMAPLAFTLGGEGALEITTSKIDAEVEAVPVAIRIPFQPPSRRTVAGLIGPFRVHIKPASAAIRTSGVSAHGKITSEGGCTLGGSAHGKVDVDLSGEFPARLLKAAVEGAFEE